MCSSDDLEIITWYFPCVFRIWEGQEAEGSHGEAAENVGTFWAPVGTVWGHFHRQHQRYGNNSCQDTVTQTDFKFKFCSYKGGYILGHLMEWLRLRFYDSDLKVQKVIESQQGEKHELYWEVVS